MPLSRPKPNARHDAIHRAVLSGLLSNVGHKTDSHEYAGARGTKFAIFPGSALFKQNPQWVMAGEIVETTKLYARTVARIQPEWVERLAEHIVKRTYSDPHYNPQTAHVTAYEKVTLYGLVLIPQRTVHFGPIDPKLAREIFIQHALAEAEYRTEAPFFRHNLKLIDEIQTLEAKSRSRDVLVDAKIRYDFYDARIPAGIYNGPLFEKWRHQIERHNPKALFMSRRDLMLHSASGITAEQFPDHLSLGSLTVPLEYHLEVGHPADGVTATVPITSLHVIPAERFEWLVPGLLREKITALIKSLPKNLRTLFVPAPDVAEAAMEAIKPGEGSLLSALAEFLSGRSGGQRITRDDFDPTTLLDHLHMNFRIVDSRNKQLAMGRDLNQLRGQLGVEARAAFSDFKHPQFTRDNLTTWDFGDLPESITLNRHGVTLTAFPALCEVRGGSPPIENHKPKIEIAPTVSLRLFESPAAARAAHLPGLRRLYMIDLRDELRYMLSIIPDLDQMCLHYSTLGPAEQLREDLQARTVSRAFLHDDQIRTAMEYELRKEAGRRHRLLEIGREVATVASQILSVYHAVGLALSKPVIPAFAPAIADIRSQIGHLLGAGFLTTTPDAWLVHYPRFIKAIQLRIAKLSSAGHSRDAMHMAEISPYWQLWLGAQKKSGNLKVHISNLQSPISNPHLDQFRWMIEELRVSLFAQELKTSIPISPKRLERQWELARAAGVKG